MLWKPLASTAIFVSVFGSAAAQTTSAYTSLPTPPALPSGYPSGYPSLPAGYTPPTNTSTSTSSVASSSAAAPTTTTPSVSGSSSAVPTTITSSVSSSSSAVPSTGRNSSSSGGSSGPQFVIYSDKYQASILPDPEQVKGYTVIALAFFLATGPADQAMSWQSLDANTRKQIKSKYNEAGIKIVVSAFGGREYPTTSGVDATKAANVMGQWVVDNDLDGIDIDYEDFNAMTLGDGKAEEWLITFTKTVRSKLPQGRYIVTHAPVAPWFSSQGYKSGAYRTVHKEVGDMIDWYNIQYYNQNDYTDCDGIVVKSSNKYPESSLQEIAQFGVPQQKLLIGKPGTPADAPSGGYMELDVFASCLEKAKGMGWSGGVMVWQFPNADAKWIQQVRAKSWAVQ